MSRTLFSFPPKDYVKKVVDPAKVTNQVKLSQLIVMKPDRKPITVSKKRKAVDERDEPPLHQQPTSGVRPEQSVPAQGGPSQRQSEDQRTAADVTQANGVMPSHPGNEEPKHESKQLERGESKKKKQSDRTQMLDTAAEERRLNEVEIGNREDSGTWWLRKPKPREPEGNAEKERTAQESRVVVWAKPQLLRKTNVLAMPYVTYLD